MVKFGIKDLWRMLLLASHSLKKAGHKQITTLRPCRNKNNSDYQKVPESKDSYIAGTVNNFCLYSSVSYSTD